MSTTTRNRTVRDFWKATKVSFMAATTTLVIIIGISIINVEYKIYKVDITLEQLLYVTSFLSISVLIWVYMVYIKGVSLKNDIFSWPASDVENGFLDLITLKRLRGFFYREKINAKQIEYVTNDFGYKGLGNKKTKYYGLNIAGDFGSRTIRFNSKQKRDEARNILRTFSKTRMESDIAFN
jgi:hypothetical protein